MIPALQECAAIELVCMASRTEEKAKESAARSGCEAVAGYDALLKRNDLDAVYIPLPTGLHDEWCTKALKAGKHLLVEKSFAMDYASAQRMRCV